MLRSFTSVCRNTCIVDDSTEPPPNVRRTHIPAPHTVDDSTGPRPSHGGQQVPRAHPRRARVVLDSPHPLSGEVRPHTRARVTLESPHPSSGEARSPTRARVILVSPEPLSDDGRPHNRAPESRARHRMHAAQGGSGVRRLANVIQRTGCSADTAQDSPELGMYAVERQRPPKPKATKAKACARGGRGGSDTRAAAHAVPRCRFVELEAEGSGSDDDEEEEDDDEGDLEGFVAADDETQGPTQVGVRGRV